ncbi:hypothetical protein BC936DRAFT_145841 [Jimgerdemannia flammicorona]|uniref:Uncharacterized protein n=1 Tax=Jimgerdemannia flammicorona TaxID=994334 RepID=A0A433D946_9FUNG|nr:hypothetical protein BC936DRAFT_145841 [Jimgerdemannia flammicorona]
MLATPLPGICSEPTAEEGPAFVLLEEFVPFAATGQYCTAHCTFPRASWLRRDYPRICHSPASNVYPRCPFLSTVARSCFVVVAPSWVVSELTPPRSSVSGRPRTPSRREDRERSPYSRDRAPRDRGDRAGSDHRDREPPRAEERERERFDGPPPAEGAPRPPAAEGREDGWAE